MSAYVTLEQKFKRMNALAGAGAMLNWDGAVMMPDGGAEARAEQQATIGILYHEMITDPAIPDLLDGAEQDTASLDNWQQANLREMRHEWLHANAVNTDLVEAYSLATSDCEMKWRQAREDSDFSALAPSLQKVVELSQQLASVKGEALGLSDYDALLDQFELGCRSDTIDSLFDDLGSFLPGFLNEVLDAQAARPALKMPQGPFAIEDQKQLGLSLMADLGFDFNRGRLDISHHPFTGGIPDDVRLTTRYEENDFTQSLMGTLHETGHALYEQNLPAKWRSQPVGKARGMALHESQSLLVEMQLSRSPEFLAYALPQIRNAFNGTGDSWTFENFMRLYHNVERGFIRVDADEVTYPLHVILRYRLEKALLSGDLAIKDLPTAWNDGMQELLGITPTNDKEGCLQDIHWPGGAIGYFPTYTLGAMAAAQFYAAAHAKLPDLSSHIEKGNFGPLIQWLKDNVHQYGCLTTTDSVLQAATGEDLNTAAFKKHLKARYLPD